MRTNCVSTSLLLVCAVGAKLGTAAAAPRIDHVVTVVTPEAPTITGHSLGDPRYIALGDLSYGATQASVAVVDLSTSKVLRPQIARATLLRRFGEADAQINGYIPPDGQLVMYTPQRFGLLLRSWDMSGPRKLNYIDVDTKTGAILRAASLGTQAPNQRLDLIGTDTHDGAWLWQVDDGTHTHDVVIRRLDLATLALTDIARITIANKTSSTGYEDNITVHAANDFSKFAVVEYTEVGLPTVPPAQVYIVEAASHTSFSVPAPTTTYGVAFSPDGMHAYLGSSDTGAIARVDLATHKIDKRVAGPTFIHHLVISPSGKTLYALASSRSFAAYDLATLARRNVRHDAALAPAMEQLFGGGIVSRDSAYFVVQQATPVVPTTIVIGPGTPPRDQEFLIGKFVD